MIQGYFQIQYLFKILNGMEPISILRILEGSMDKTGFHSTDDWAGTIEKENYDCYEYMDLNRQQQQLGIEKRERICRNLQERDTYTKKENELRYKKSTSINNATGTTTTQKHFEATTTIPGVLPTSYEEAMSSNHATEWQATMNEELTALDDNDTWKLVDKPEVCDIVDIPSVHKFFAWVKEYEIPYSLTLLVLLVDD
ncbi:hypothetical protein QE152_g35260 [Popillia japonica]|uniref:Uncharacterized protein n=1 Tax=Popillia japonica TaxID=7064 RepID=A0AAW1IFW1_POPJA